VPTAATRRCDPAALAPVVALADAPGDEAGEATAEPAGFAVAVALEPGLAEAVRCPPLGLAGWVEAAVDVQEERRARTASAATRLIA